MRFVLLGRRVMREDAAIYTPSPRQSCEDGDKKIVEELAQLLVTAREADLVTAFRACCLEHKEAIEALTGALSVRCIAIHNPQVIPLIRIGK